MAGTAVCRVCPNDNCDIVGSYTPSGRVTLTCYAQTVSNQCMSYCAKADPFWSDSYQNGPNKAPRVDWYRTINNCYVRANMVRAGES
jgi:hypothetical protein